MTAQITIDPFHYFLNDISNQSQNSVRFLYLFPWTQVIQLYVSSVILFLFVVISTKISEGAANTSTNSKGSSCFESHC